MPPEPRPDGHRVPVADGVELAYVDAGEGGRPLVLVHGFTGFRQDFATHFDALSARGRTLAVDLRGHGESTHLGSADAYGLDAMADDLVRFLERLELPPVDLLGHSMGGMLVLRAALRAPERIASLMLMDTSAEPIDPIGEEELRLAGQIAREAGMKVLAGILRDRSDSDPSRSEADRRVEQDWGTERFWAWRNARVEATDGHAFEALIRAMAGAESLVDALPRIAVPATVMVGEEDHDFLAPSETLAAGIPDAERAWIPQAAHQPQHENPRAWRAAVEAHLARVRG
ncbi:MAG: alpha/beta fold hydrolase [Myxococcota bacterium]|nr:alpha/beta fold hydrolase [Myxococcota bacterium]